ncbi:MAG: class I SAM-dependent methyltransferase [Ignavibacteriaceae bacterium]|nr:class I SAM-dependent methyltransferase [Ignavibacteriaceae bacterium]
MAKIEPFDKYLNDYEEWFKEHKYVYESELEAVRHFIPIKKKGVEIGIGTGRFAVPLNIKEGVEPSTVMRDYSSRLGLTVYDGIAEKLPLDNESYDFVLMVTTICFVDDLNKAVQEVQRILKPDGSFIIGLVDKDSSLGKAYEKLKEQNKFYRYATFYSADEVKNLLEENSFTNIEIVQTVFGKLDSIHNIQDYFEGYGDGGFVVIKADIVSET